VIKPHSGFPPNFETVKTNWILNCTLGLVLGVGLSTGILTSLDGLFPPGNLALGAVAVLGICLAGALQGAVLGHFQYPGVAAAVPGLPRTAWLRNSVVAGVLLWAVSCIPLLLPYPAQHQFVEGTTSVPWFWLWLAVAGLLCLFAFGFAQALVLRPLHKTGAGAWLRANAVGWLLGTFLVMLLQGLIVISPLVVYGLLFVCLVVGAGVTALVLRVGVQVLARPAKP